MKRARTALGMAVLLAAGGSLAGNRAITVRTATVTVADVVPRCGDADVCGAVLRDDLAPGAQVAFRAAAVRRLLARQGLSARGVRLPQKALVRRAARTLDAAAASEEIRRAIAAALPDRVALVDARVQRSVRVPVDAYAWEVHVDEAALRGPTVSLAVDLVEDGRTWWSQRVLCTVRYAASVPVAAAPIPPGTIVEPWHVNFVETWTSRPHADVAAGAVVGRRARRAYAPGDALRVDDLDPVLLVTKGRPVTVVSRMGAVHVSTRGTARQSGAAGDRVAVELPAVGRVVFARVEGPGYAVVEP